MFKRISLFIVLFVPLFIFAESLVNFPSDIKSMVLVKQSVFPGKNVALAKETPLFMQEIVSMYNWINNGEGTKLNIYIPKNKITQYKTHGPYSDGVTAVAIYEDQDIVFVTEHLFGEPLYAAYNSEGKDISDTHESFNTAACYRCHEGNSDICINGTCAVPIIDIFK